MDSKRDYERYEGGREREGERKQRKERKVQKEEKSLQGKTMD